MLIAALSIRAERQKKHKYINRKIHTHNVLSPSSGMFFKLKDK